MAAWLIQWSPLKYRVFDAIAAGEVIDNVSVNQQRDRIADGDGMALWLSSGQPGYEAGVYATGIIRSAAKRGTVDNLWISQQPGPDWYVKVTIDRYVFHSPVSRAELKADPIFSAHRIFVVPVETSYSLTAREWDAIDRRVARRQPSPVPTVAFKRSP